MKILAKIAFAIFISSSFSGCFLTKVVSVPMRLGAAVVSIVPGVGNSAHDAIDVAAETVDDVPI